VERAALAIVMGKASWGVAASIGNTSCDVAMRLPWLAACGLRLADRFSLLPVAAVPWPMAL
jgi:hypothetical protein